MNKYQAAFKSISDNQYQYGSDEDWELMEKLVDKETPDKWNECFGEIICPICGKHWNIIDNCTETFKHCPNCGKKLDWSE